MDTSTAPDLSGSGRVDTCSRARVAALRAAVATRASGEIETHLSDTWRYESSSIIFTHPPEVKKSNKNIFLPNDINHRQHTPGVHPDSLS